MFYYEVAVFDRYRQIRACMRRELFHGVEQCDGLRSANRLNVYSFMVEGNAPVIHTTTTISVLNSNMRIQYCHPQDMCPSGGHAAVRIIERICISRACFIDLRSPDRHKRTVPRYPAPKRAYTEIAAILVARMGTEFSNKHSLLI